MKKKNLLTMGLGLMLTMVVVVGGTLAYLSSTDTITNTFTVGKGYEEDDKDHQGIWLDETEVDEAGNVIVGEDGEPTGQRTESDQKYPNMLPGRTVVKDPTAHMVGGSVASYVFVKVEGVDALEALKMAGKDGAEIQCFEVDEFNSDWKKVDPIGEGRDGYYLYVGENYNNGSNIVDVSGIGAGVPCDLTAIFTQVSMNPDLVEIPEKDYKLPEITVSAYAVQAADDMNGYEDALKAIK